MMNLLNVVGFVVFCSGIAGFILNKAYIFNSLLSLELLALSVYFLMSGVDFSLSESGYNILFYLVMVVCEGAMGLSLLVMVSFSHGGVSSSGFSGLVC